MTMPSMNAGALRLRSICDLLGESFHVPEYQRGYRWTDAEVTTLLDDLSSFQRATSDGGKNAYYCLQPIVVRARDDGRWDLVDGQQRLTTIRLVLHALRTLVATIGKQPFDISYESRPESADFLRDPVEELAGTYVDFHYMFQAYRAIERWFAKRDGAERLDFLNSLTRADGDKPNVRVIWYELDRAESPEEAFIRLNAGRIPLTSAELIRALLLRSDDQPIDVRDAHQIAQDWDLVERRLHDDAYWYFLQSATDPPPTRIGYLFDLFVAVEAGAPLTSTEGDPLGTFLAFQKLLEAKGSQPGVVWRNFKRTVQTLESWFDDPVLFHLVGYLVATAPTKSRDAAATRRAGADVLRTLLGARRRMTATEFDRHLRWLAWHRFLGTTKVPAETRLTAAQYESSRDERLDELEYGRDGVVRALLLVNIASQLEVIEAQRRRDSGAHDDASAAPRFQFARFARESWDVEHVRSVAEYVPTSPARRKEWLEQARKFVARPFVAAADQKEARRWLTAIDALLKDGLDTAKFDGVFAGIRRLSGEAEARDGDDALSNLVLLDMSTNRSYKNAVFPVKRERIIELDREGTYVPPATRNVFLKYYSPDATQVLVWDAQDQQSYDDALRATLDTFFAPLQEDDR